MPSPPPSDLLNGFCIRSQWSKKSTCGGKHIYTRRVKCPDFSNPPCSPIGHPKTMLLELISVIVFLLGCLPSDDSGAEAETLPASWTCHLKARLRERDRRRSDRDQESCYPFPFAIYLSISHSFTQSRRSPAVHLLNPGVQNDIWLYIAEEPLRSWPGEGTCWEK